MNDQDILQEYRKLGTISELRAKLVELKSWHTRRRNNKILDVDAQESTVICHCCDHKDDYIEELQAELLEYRDLGTADEFRKLKEKDSPIYVDLSSPPILCPACDTPISMIDVQAGHCKWCGQVITSGK